MLASCLLHACYAVYLWVLRVRRGVVWCGCLGEASRASRGAALRSFVLAAVVAAFVLGADATALPAVGRAVALGGAVLVVALILLGERMVELWRETDRTRRSIT